MNPYSYAHTPDKHTIMSATTETQADTTSGDKTEEKKEETSETTTTTTTTTSNKQADNKSMKKVRSKKDLKNDPSRFESPGVNFNAKLIGIDEVSSARGDKMCQESLQRLKLAVKSSGQHKQKIIVNVSLEGVRLIDLRSQAVNHTHLVHRISFISRDITDSRAFGYVYGAEEKKHKFYAIKTEKAAEALVLTLRDLFQVVYEMKKKEVEEAKHKQEEVEKADEAKDTEEPVYQVPKNGAPVENKEDPTYQVPKNNAPVTQNEENLLSLENELQSIEKGIEQMNDLEDMFSDLRSPTTPSTTAWGAELQGTMSQPPVNTQPAFSVGGAPFSATLSTMPPGGNPMFGQPLPAAGPAPGGFGNQPWGANMAQPGMAQPGMAPGGLPAGAPFGAPNVPPRTGMGLPPPPGHPGHPGHAAHPGGFPPTPFPGPGQLNRPGFPQVPQPNVAAQAPAPANDPFGNDPFAMGDTGGFGDNLLAPEKIEVPQEEPPTEPPGKKDAFGDLVDIGAKDKQNKSPKQMFVELAAPPKKSLNELKVDNTPAPKPASPVGFQASEAPEGVKTGTSPSPADFSTLDQFGNKDPFGSEDPFGSNDPFAGSFPNQNQETHAPKLEPTAQNGTNTLSAPSQNTLFGGSIFDDDFNLPVPKGPPPPLPTNIDSVSTRAFNIPPPPPRHNVNTPSNTPHTPPLPPRPKSSSTVQTASNILPSSSAEAVHGHTPQLPPRLHSETRSSHSITVPKDSLSDNFAKDKGTINSTLNNKDKELTLDGTNTCDTDKTKENMKNITTGLNCSVVTGVSQQRNDLSEVSSNKGDSAVEYHSAEASVDRVFTQSDRDENELSQSANKQNSIDLFDKSSVSDKTLENLNNIKNLEILGDNKTHSDINKNLSNNQSRSIDHGANSDTGGISENIHSSSHADTTEDKVHTDSTVGKETDQNFNKTSVSSVADPFVTIDPFANDDPFAQTDPFSSDPFASDPFSDSVSITSVSSTTSSNDPFTSAFPSQRASSASVDTAEDPFSVFDNSFEPFHFEKSKKSKVKLKFQGGQ